MAGVISDSAFSSVDEICAWLNDGTAPTDLQVEKKHLWARTYRLENGSRTRYLKDIPPVQRGALAALPLLSERFPRIVPRTVSVDVDRGLFLQESHDGRDLGRRIALKQKQDLLGTYAGLQAEAARQDDLLKLLPRIELPMLVQKLIAFLDPAGSPDELTTPALAREFFNEDRCRYYHELFTARADRLMELLSAAEALPVTINHCDLRPGNAAIRENGELIIYDWDESVAAPAGLSLHNFFSGCSLPCEMLLDPPSAMTSERSDSRILLGRYLRTLVDNGYASSEQLTAGLPGSICAGVINFVLSYSRFLPPDESYRQDIADILRKRLNDLLDFADFLQTSSKHALLDMVADYEDRDRRDRAGAILKLHVRRHPDDVDATLRLADCLSADGSTSQARKLYKKELERDPDCAAAHRGYGMFLLNELRFQDAADHLAKAVTLGYSDDAIALALAQATEYLKVCRNAEQAGQIPTLRISPEELKQGKLNPLHKRLAVSLFKEYGTLMFENAFPVSLVQQMLEQYLERYQQYFVNKRHSDALKVGSKRYMITVDVDGAFNTPQLYANPFVSPVIRELLGGDMIMGGFNSVCSLPGSEHMRIHKDHPALFPESDDPDSLSSFAITTVVAMRGFNREAGTTRVFKRSHHCPSKQVKDLESQDPEGPQGACLLMDYRLSHQGRANLSNDVRPILTMIYHRPWFRDIVNYGMQDPMRISDAAFAEIPEEHRPLFDWARGSVKSPMSPKKADSE